MFMVDLHEPKDLYTHLSQSIPDTQRANLNGEGKHIADFMWTNGDNKYEMAERKHWTEIIPDLDKVELQLDQQRTEWASVHYLIIEDLMLPTATGVVTYTNLEERSRRGSKGTYLGSKRGWHSFKKQPQAYYRIMSWLFRLNKSGLEVWFSPNTYTTSIILTALYHQSIKPPEQQLAFQHYYRKKAPHAIRNPHMISLMGIEGARMGPKTAGKLVERFGTLYNVLITKESDLVICIGRAATTTLLKAIGR